MIKYVKNLFNTVSVKSGWEESIRCGGVYPWEKSYNVETVNIIVSGVLSHKILPCELQSDLKTQHCSVGHIFSLDLNGTKVDFIRVNMTNIRWGEIYYTIPALFEEGEVYQIVEEVEYFFIQEEQKEQEKIKKYYKELRKKELNEILDYYK